MRLSVAIFASLVAALVALPATAQTIPSPYEYIDERQEFGILVTQFGEQRGALQLGPGGGTGIGARFGLQISGPLGLEGNAAFFSTDRHVRVPDEESGIDDLGSAEALVGMFDARVRFSLPGNRTWHRLAPYLTAGAGVAFDFEGRSELEDEIPESVRFTFGPSFLGILGAGVRFLPADRITVRAEASVQYWKLGTPETFVEQGESVIGQPVPDQEWAPVPALSLGISWRR